MKTDFFVFTILEGLLILMFIRFVYLDNRNKVASEGMEMTRGESSMNALYVNFGIITLIFTIIVQTCCEIKGNQALFILTNYGILTYLFFFSSRFRNQVFFKLINRIKKD